MTRSSGYDAALAAALPREPENAWTRGGSVLVIVGGVGGSELEVERFVC